MIVKYCSHFNVQTEFALSVCSQFQSKLCEEKKEH